MGKDEFLKTPEQPALPRDRAQHLGARTLDFASVNRLKTDPEVLEAFGKDFPVQEFVRLGIHEISDVRRDARYANAKRAEYGDERYRAKTLEEVVRHGIVKNNWLGEDFSGATVFQTTRYDDYQNRNDIVVSADDLSFSIDVTYNSTKLQDKLSRPTNDAALNAQLPPGFSRVKYFDDGKSIGDERLPRFVVGLDYFDNAANFKQPHSPAGERVRFKILSELCVQAKKHYATMLETDPDVAQDSTIAMENLYYAFDESLRDAVTDLRLAKDSSFAGIQTKLAGTEKFADQCHIIEESLATGDGVYKDTMRVLTQS